QAALYTCLCLQTRGSSGPPRGEVSIPSLSEGSGYYTGVRDPMGGPGLRGGPDSSGGPEPRLFGLPASSGTRVVPGPFPVVRQVRDRCREIRTPDHRGPAVWTLSRITSRPLPRHSKRGYPSPG